MDKMRLVEEIKSLRRNMQYWYKFGRKIRKIRKNGKKIYVCAVSAVHGNMGDQALGFCMNAILKKNGIPKREIIEYTTRDRMRYWPQICRAHSNADVILLRGGGYWGDLWLDGFAETMMYIQKFSDNKIIVFPQSVFFSETLDGISLLKQSQEIVRHCKKLHIFARDRVSYELLNKYYPTTTIGITPDTVLAYRPHGLQQDNRDGVLLCLRNDKEKKVKGLDNCAIELLKQMKIKYSYQDTNIDFDLQKLSEREPKLYEMWKIFSNAKLVITDRLHGIIFSAITGTPCIVFDNIDGKVGHQYEWIRDLPYIKYLNHLSDLNGAIKNLLDSDPMNQYPLERIANEFEPLESALKQL